MLCIKAEYRRESKVITAGAKGVPAATRSGLALLRCQRCSPGLSWHNPPPPKQHPYAELFVPFLWSEFALCCLLHELKREERAVPTASLPSDSKRCNLTTVTLKKQSHPQPDLIRHSALGSPQGCVKKAAGFSPQICLLKSVLGSSRCCLFSPSFPAVSPPLWP